MLAQSRILSVALLASVLLATALPAAGAEARYTRAKSEELFHLIRWQDYAPQTFEKALQEQKPIYLVISAPAWCYWCHVYESEDYLYHPRLYPYINEHFVPVFVDSDKRPDLTRKYLEGGWPSTTILAPDMRRMAGFTGPRDPVGLLAYLQQAVAYVRARDFTSFAPVVNYQQTPAVVPTDADLRAYEARYLQSVEEAYDPVYGGVVVQRDAWREGQKFPAPFADKFLLEAYEDTGNATYLELVRTTFRGQYTDAMGRKTRYRLYDPVEGGFHRYSTKRDWSVPHYEKLLADQAKLVRAYAHLHNLTGEPEVRTAVDGTIAFVLEKFYDPKGGFHSSQDAYLEEAYFGLSREERASISPPHIDKTKPINGNAMMIGTFLSLYNATGRVQYGEVARRSLDFLQERMVGDDGANFYFDDDLQEAFLTGQSVSNAWALLAFVEGYEVLHDERYLKTAAALADYALAELYDWKSGGFFDRHSRDAEFYAPNERIDLSKPFEENAVFAYGTLKLYLQTGRLEYLEAGVKTLGYLSDKFGGFDEAYYFLEAAKAARAHGLLAVYAANQAEIGALAGARSRTFFVDDLIAQQKAGASIEDAPQLQSEFTNIGFFVLAILALSAGVLSFLSPCCLPVLSAYVAHNVRAGKGQLVKNTAFFVLGLAAVFSLFGMGATLIGGFFRDHRLLFTRAAGAAIVGFGVLEVFGKGFSGWQLPYKGGRKRPMGAFVFGAVFALGWSACIGPILASLLLLSAASGTVLKGSLLLFIYALGVGVPLLMVSMYFDRIRDRRFWMVLQGRVVGLRVFGKEWQFHTTYVVSGIMLVGLGLLIFNDYLFALNRIALQSGFVQNGMMRVEELLKRIFIG